MKPDLPLSMTSGTEPYRNAITGIPQAMASIITSPKGSGQSIGKSRASALPKIGLITLDQYSISALSIFAAIFNGNPTFVAISIARSGRFSGEIRPRKAR